MPQPDSPTPGLVPPYSRLATPGPRLALQCPGPVPTAGLLDWQRHLPLGLHPSLAPLFPSLLGWHCGGPAQHRPPIRSLLMRHAVRAVQLGSHVVITVPIWPPPAPPCPGQAPDDNSNPPTLAPSLIGPSCAIGPTWFVTSAPLCVCRSGPGEGAAALCSGSHMSGRLLSLFPHDPLPAHGWRPVLTKRGLQLISQVRSTHSPGSAAVLTRQGEGLGISPTWQGPALGHHGYG